nr:hypothetical protein [uncultured Alistipes sp.]
MGGLILVASIAIWALSYFPHYTEQDMTASNKYKTMIQAEQGQTDTAAMLSQYQQSESFLGHIGHFVEPAMRPRLCPSCFRRRSGSPSQKSAF